MGNAGSGSSRDRQKAGEPSAQHSPSKEDHAFVFDKKPNSKLVFQSSNEEEEPYFSKGEKNENEFGGRQRSATLSEGSKSGVSDKALPTVFKWDGGGKNVLISGTFSNWKTLPMVKSHGDFVTIIDLPEGEHQYKFYVDGEWKHDPGSRIVDNGMGSKNNLVTVKKSDFEVFQALAMDSESISSNQQREYSQEIPANRPWEKPSGPPILPPHLLQVILNKDTPLSCEPTLLPEPNHVMLNHLYALSIKDGVMVLSATHRYRKKSTKSTFTSDYPDPVSGPFTNYVKPRFIFDKLEEISNLEDPSNCYNRLLEKYPILRYHVDGEPDQSVIEEHYKGNSRTVYQVEISKQKNGIASTRQRVVLPKDWGEIPLTTQRAGYRDTTKLATWDLKPKPVVPPKASLDPNLKEREILKVRTGLSEYEGKIGLLGSEILKDEYYGHIDDFKSCKAFEAKKKKRLLREEFRKH